LGSGGVELDSIAKWAFYTNVGVDYARFMCSWDTTAEDVEALAADLKELTVAA